MEVKVEDEVEQIDTPLSLNLDLSLFGSFAWNRCEDVATIWAVVREAYLVSEFGRFTHHVSRFTR